MSSSAGVVRPSRSVDGLSMYLVEQRWEQNDIADIEGEVLLRLGKTHALDHLPKGASVAITAGSRGIASMPAALRAVIRAVRQAGGEPFIFPAMGSHGGGTAEGQRQILADMGIDEEHMGVPVRSSMEVVQIGVTTTGMPVYIDRYASEADGIILVNRIKKHTNFDGPIESGLCKMAVIGMGKHTQASALHRYGNQGLAAGIVPAAQVVFEHANVLAGVGLVENAWGGLADIAVLGKEQIVDEEPALLRKAKALSAKIPFAQLDLLVVEQMGKEISGTGMDCYVIGRRRIVGEPEWPEAPSISSLVLLDITEASHGNGVGVGLADFASTRLVRKIDWEVTKANILTSGNLERGKIPLSYDTDREVIEAAAFRERVRPLEQLRVACIRDTLHLRRLLVSAALLDTVRESPELRLLSGPMALPLSADGQWHSPLAD